MTQDSTPPGNVPDQKGKLQLPDGTTASAGIDIANVKSAILVKTSGGWAIEILLADGTTITVPGTDGNVAYLEGIGIHVANPKASSDFGPT